MALVFFFLTGNFQLDLSWQPVCEAMKGKLHWAEMMAKKKHVDFEVEDAVGFFGNSVPSSTPFAASDGRLPASLSGYFDYKIICF